MNADTAVEQAPVAPSLTEQYETLRTAALGDGLPLQARSGLALFLRRGMWGWARSATVPSRLASPPRALFASSNADDERRAVIHLFAAMAIRSTKRSVP